MNLGFDIGIISCWPYYSPPGCTFGFGSILGSSVVIWLIMIRQRDGLLRTSVSDVFGATGGYFYKLPHDFDDFFSPEPRGD